CVAQLSRFAQLPLLPSFCGMGIANTEPELDWVERKPDHLAIVVDSSLYPDEAVFRACYAFTDRCYLFLERLSPSQLKLHFRARRHAISLMAVAGEFGNELINQRIRYTLARETRPIRELIVAQAFAEAPLDQG